MTDYDHEVPDSDSHRKNIDDQWEELHTLTAGKPWVQSMSHPATLSRPAGGHTICRARWSRSTIADWKEFYRLLKEGLPEGTLIFGQQLFQVNGLYYYGALLGFPCALRFWDGYAQNLYMLRPDGLPDTLVVTIEVGISSDLNGSKDFFDEQVHRLVTIGDDTKKFGKPMTWEDVTNPCGARFDNAAGMWKALAPKRREEVFNILREMYGDDWLPDTDWEYGS